VVDNGKIIANLDIILVWGAVGWRQWRRRQ